MKKMNINIEQKKSLSLMLLFLLSILLTVYKFNILGGFLFSKGSPYSYALTLEEGLQKTIRPYEITIHFGGDNNTQILSNKQRYYQETNILLKQALKNASKIMPISPNDFEQAQTSRSLHFRYPSLQGKLLSRSLFLEQSPIDALEEINEILIPLLNENFFYIQTNAKVYQVETKPISSLILIDELEKSTYLNYRPLNSIFETKSKTLVPTRDFNFKYEQLNAISSFSEAERIQLAQRIFGKKYDFTMRITETDASEIYSYNYGQQVLKIQPNGYIRYKNDDINVKNASLEESMHAALEFMNDIQMDLDNLCFSEAKNIKVQGRNAFSFTFVHTMKDLRILSKSQLAQTHLIVIGGEVYSYSSTSYTVLPYDISKDSHILAPLATLNPSSFSSILQTKFNEVDIHKFFDKIHGIELIYYMKINDNTYQLTPYWKINIDKKDYLFNAYTGEMEPYGLV